MVVMLLWHARPWDSQRIGNPDFVQPCYVQSTEIRARLCHLQKASGRTDVYYCGDLCS